MADSTKQGGLAGFFAAVFVPPAVAAGLGQSFVHHHPVSALAIWLAYEATVAIAGYFGGIADALLTLWREPVVAHLDRVLRRQGRRFEQRYRQFTLDGLTNIDQKGLTVVGEFTPALEAVFRDIALESRPPQDIQPGVLPGLASEQSGRHGIGDLLGDNEPRVLAVVGAPGSGKTTLMQHTARQACLHAPPRRGRRRTHVRHIPILLYLRDHADNIIADPSVSLPMLARTTLTPPDAEPAGWFEQKLRDGECLVLLDGLDEVALPKDRADVAAWVERQVRAYSRNDFVITSRPLGYQSARVERANIVQACGFTARQVELFVRSWYHEVEMHSISGAAKVDSDEINDRESRAREQANDLLKNLADTPALYDLAVNPLLLTMIANLHRHGHRHRHSLPRTKASLYSEICGVMLGRRQEAKGIALPLSSEKKQAILARLAYTMMDRRVSDLSRTEVLAVIKPALRRASGNVTPGDFLAEARADGLLIERDRDRFAFAHKTFQEYLAAVHIRKKDYVGKLSGVVNDDWWAEVILFHAGQSDASPVIEACLKTDTIATLALALECAEQSGALDPKLQARLDAVQAAATRADELSPSAPDLRRLAGILLSMHLRHRSSTVTGSQVCVRPIPAEIYLLFLADKQIPEPDADPAILQTPTAIAAGVRASDALAFVTWANTIMGGQPTYRLPVAAELNDLAAQQRIPALPSGSLPEAWVLADDASAGTPRLCRFTPRVSPVPGLDEVSLIAAIEDDLAAPIPLLGPLLLLRSRIADQLSPFLLTTYDHSPGITLDPDSDPALNTVLAPARDLALALSLDLAQPLARTQTIPFDDDLALTLARARAGEVDLDKALTRTREFDLNLARLLARSTNAAKVREIDPPTIRVGRQGPYDTLTRPLFESVTPLVMGQALSWALAQARRTAAQSASPVNQFATAFAAAVRIEASEPPGDPDLLPEKLQRAPRC